MRYAALALLVLLIGCSATDRSGDVTVIACSRTADFGPVATLEIHNAGSEALDYRVTVTFHAADGSSGKGYSGDVSVPAGQTQQAQVSAVGNRGPMPKSCDVSDVSAS